MARMNIAEKRLPQDGCIEIKVGNKDIDIRVSTLPTAFGERVVLRLLDKSTIRLSLTDLGMTPERLALFERMIRSPNGILAQRLVRVICAECMEEYRPSPEELARIGVSEAQLPYGTLKRGRGCGKCLDTGYRGRTGIHEFLVLDEKMKKMILQTSDASQLRSQARRNGMKPLLQDGADKVIKGITTVEEVYRVAQS
jgi:general secretion pathway protein E